jgi:uncharacterized membrane protein (UPF0127 family)
VADQYAALRLRASGAVLLPQVRLCTSFMSRLRGLMFRRTLSPGEALLLDERRDSRAGTTIHMFFVPFAIAAVWIDTSGRVVDKVLALPWRPFYGAQAPARYILETDPAFLDRIAINDEVEFVPSTTRA